MILNNIIKKINQNLTRVYKFSDNKKLKKDKSILTDSDIIIQNIVSSELKKKLKNNYYLISEEKNNNAKDYTKYRYLVTLDPIDGTENFYSGLPEWGLSISIYKDLKHFESCIFLPGIKKFLKTKSKVKKKNSRIKSFSSSVKIKDLKVKGEFRLFGCCVYSIYHVIKGSLKNYRSDQANSWDILAGANLAIEHGLDVKIDNRKYYGRFLHPKKKYKIQISN
tara:strand:- start:140 stop:805 length:666 start_codon:yes stop_codon:yes gene_type:complete